MKQWVKKLTSAFLASLLTVSLNGQIHAESEEEPIPEPPLQISEPSASTDTQGEADDAPAVTDDAPAVVDDGSAASDDAQAEEDDAEVVILRVNADQTMTDAEGDELPETQDASTFTQLEDGSYVLVNHTGSESLQADGDITILAAGLNRVSSISGTGKVNIAGTGILLVDSLEGELDLMTLTDIYNEGSTAVFVKQTDDSYLLVNGAVPGILDEEYTIDDASLVMPAQSSLLLCGTGAEAIRDNDGNVTAVNYYHGTEHNYSASNRENVIEQVGRLTITGAASLLIRQGAALLMENLKSLGFTNTDDFMRYPELAVTNGGTLTVEGDVTGGGFVTVDGNDSSLSGSGSVTTRQITIDDPDAIGNADGTFSARDIYLNGDGTYQDLTIDNSTVHVGNGSAGFSGLHTSGSSTILLSSGADVDLSSVDGTLALRLWGDRACTVSGDVDGSGTLRFEIGTYLLDEGIKLNQVSISTETGGNVFDYPDVLETCLPLMRISPEDMTRADESENQSIPVAGVWMIDHAEKNKLSWIEVVQIAENKSIQATCDENQKLVLSPTALRTRIEAYKTSAGWNEVEGAIKFELLHLNDGVLSLDTFEESQLTQFPADDVCLVRIIFQQATSFVEPAGTATQTGTVFTGSGILGGNGAGSVHYGSTNHNDPIEPDDDNGKENGAPDDNGKENGDPGRTEGAPDDNGKENGDPGRTETVTAPQAATVWVDAQSDGIHYTLCAAEGEKTLRDLGGRVSVSMRYELPPQDTGKALYAVFRNADGTITAARARYSGLKGELSFETDRLGTFVIVAFDFDGEEFSDAFYAALEDLLERQSLN